MDRKPWELTDNEVIVGLSGTRGISHNPRSLATAAARKALEWAAAECDEWLSSSGVQEAIRDALKELSDG